MPCRTSLFLHHDTHAMWRTSSQSFRGTRTGEAEGGVSEDARKKAEAAKSYIENLYKSKETNRQSRDERYAAGSCVGVCP